MNEALVYLKPRLFGPLGIDDAKWLVSRDGQFCIVIPDQDAVIAITAQTGDMQAEINVVWDKLLPALHPDPLPPNPDEDDKLKQTLAALEVHPAEK